ncbi:arginine repressor [Oscillospiraceae bacterium CM]|nr:arginine repressor [Oscillospiraceae bacterium CM]
MKNKRQNAILKIIASQDIETQNQLIEALGEAGVESTQATVSRDIKELHLVKELTAQGRYHYVIGQKQDLQNYASRLKSIFKECVTSFVSAQNIVVIKTLPGLAPAACSTIDAMNIKNLAGSIAGDDTAFLAMSDNAAAERFCQEIQDMLY